MEIERKYLVKTLPILPAACKRITQQYLAITKDEEVRIRRVFEGINSEFVLTIKFGTGMTRKEIETKISCKLFEQMFNANKPTINKHRYCIHDRNSGCKFEVDVYQQQLSGLITVEVEFDTENAANAFKPPDWFGKDVTTDASYKNKNLADGIQTHI